jgi:hypothetical protein
MCSTFRVHRRAEHSSRIRSFLSAKSSPIRVQPRTATKEFDINQAPRLTAMAVGSEIYWLGTSTTSTSIISSTVDFLEVGATLFSSSRLAG